LVEAYFFWGHPIHAVTATSFRKQELPQTFCSRFRFFIMLANY